MQVGQLWIHLGKPATCKASVMRRYGVVGRNRLVFAEPFNLRITSVLQFRSRSLRIRSPSVLMETIWLLASRRVPKLCFEIVTVFLGAFCLILGLNKNQRVD